MKLSPIRGTKDLLPEEFRKHNHITQTAKKVSSLYGFEEVATPIFENTEVFKRTLGEDSDIVHKEMFSFETKGGDAITLRPEFTASIARSFISNGLQQNLPLKLFSHGPLFRYERPQRGRQRQFHQINFERIGERSPFVDAEMIMMAGHVLGQIGILDKVELHVNSLADDETREAYKKALIKYLSNQNLSEDSQRRLWSNPLRILDSKDPSDREILKKAPIISDFYTEDAKNYFRELISLLKYVPNLQDLIIIDPLLVRGLDYYSHTVFEFIAKTDELGAQNTVIAGGRYDKLIKQMGGADVPAIGFAGGVERLALMVNENVVPQKIKPVCVFSVADHSLDLLAITNVLRNLGFVTEIITGGNFKKKLQKADKRGAKNVVIIEEKSNEENYVLVKNMYDGAQQKVSILDDDNISEELLNALN